ncbi:MAG TPA: CvpA family protein [Thermoflexia bacterium]|nr:CvpA family protein [Thermoflexia bacterium]
MSIFDILLILVGLGMVALGAYRRFIGSLFLLVGAYVASLSAAIIYEQAAYGLSAIGKGAHWFEGVVFIVLYFLIFTIFFIVSLFTYSDTSLPQLRFLDPLLGAVGGLVPAAISMAMLWVGFNFIVSEYWEPYTSYTNLYNFHTGARLGPLVRQMLSFYLPLLYPFFWISGLPPVFLNW